MKTLQDINNEIALLEQKLGTVKGTETEVYTRIVGYHRAIANWNNGKKEEYKFRATFSVNDAQVETKIDEYNNSMNNNFQSQEKSKIENIGQIAFYKLFYSQRCRNCPPVKEFMKNSNIPGEEMDVTTDLGLNSAKKYNVMATPTVILFDSQDNVLLIATNLEELQKAFKEEKVLISA